MFTPIRTQRLLIRTPVPEDVEPLVARRNDPDTARFQTWGLPFLRERARYLVEDSIAMGGPQNDQWWMATVVDAATGDVVGDLAYHLSWERRTAEVGYTFAREHWGRGYAVEATEALVAYSFEQVGATRVCGMLHPDNPASAMVLERCGMLFEGHTRSSFWVGDEVSDDWLYGMTRDDWERWRTRPQQPPDQVTLVEISAGNAADVARLATHKSQERFVAPVSQSYGDALFPEEENGAPIVPWMRAVAADGELVGFVMLALSTEHHPEPFLWRLLIDRLHQRRRIGDKVVDLVAAECRTRGDRTLLVSWVDGKGSPLPFYLRNGFEPTGRVVDGEVEGRKVLSTRY